MFDDAAQEGGMVVKNQVKMEPTVQGECYRLINYGRDLVTVSAVKRFNDLYYRKTKLHVARYCRNVLIFVAIGRVHELLLTAVFKGCQIFQAEKDRRLRGNGQSLIISHCGYRGAEPHQGQTEIRDEQRN